MADFSPMMKQYFQIKEQHPNTILFFRLGDFYEMFYNDAKTVSKELELTLTGKECGQSERAPMCGVPYHSAEGYIAKLVEKGYKVAICEQTEDPKKAKGLVKRDVIRVITPGTVLESSMLDENSNNYICSLFYDGQHTGVVIADVSTGDMHANIISGKGEAEHEYALQNELARYNPSELVLNPAALNFAQLAAFASDKLKASVECLTDADYNEKIIESLVYSQFNRELLEREGISEKPQIIMALGALLTYLKRTQITGLERLNHIELERSSVMRLDINARRNLELTETLRNKERKGSLLWVLDKTKTAMGKRLIKSWIEQPLLSPAEIIKRQNAVEELYENPQLLDEVREALAGIYDLERIITRVVYGSANARELRSLGMAASKIPSIKALLEKSNSKLLNSINTNMDSLADITQLVEESIVDEPPFTIREGGMIRVGYSTELDEIRGDKEGGQDLIAGVEASEREKTGIPKLKIGYNRVFGYYIEVTNSYKDKVPEEYIRKQTLTSGERYITGELKDIENRILGANEKAVALESKLYEEIRQHIAKQLDRIQSTAEAVAVLDVIASFAEVSRKNDYTKPQISINGNLYMKDSRHPVVELLLENSLFVPNDVDMNMKTDRISLITGPNMAGKSTYMRQVAIITIMAQIGCFVPCAAADIGIVDSIFTRVGASDDLAAGQSTFMIEMTEVADILKNSTNQSLLIFDEIGRGTSTFDGMSIAKSVLEYVQKTVGAKTLFATHYHELTSVERELDGVKNYNVAVKKRGDDITFLRKIIRGGADDSYGIEVAKLAGVPDRVIKRAKEILTELEAGEIYTGEPISQNEEPMQLLMSSVESDVINKLKSVDVNTLTPIESMNLIYEISKLID